MFANHKSLNLHKVLSTKKITYQPTVNYYIIAIASVLKDYRLSFFLNQDLHLQLEKTEDLLTDNKAKESAQTFGKYYYLDDKSEFEYFLVQNKQQGNVYVKTLKNFDFLFIVKTIDEEAIDTSTFFNKIKEIKDLQLALEVRDLKASERKLIESNF